LFCKDHHRIEKRPVEVTTLDELLHPIAELEAPIILKIDSEGSELNTLRGGRELLRSVAFIIVEVSIAKRFEDRYSFEELVAFMGENGFEVFSFLSVAHSPRELRPRFVDIVFSRTVE
jgi:hypothetical protein